jgi:hypothetical protein
MVIVMPTLVAHRKPGGESCVVRRAMQNAKADGIGECVLPISGNESEGLGATCSIDRLGCAYFNKNGSITKISLSCLVRY